MKAMTIIQAVVWMVIMAVIVFVSIVLMSDRFNMFDSNLRSCATKGGSCVASVSDCDGLPSPFKCPNEEHVCCMAS